jgi:glucan phosphorylase
VQKPDRGRSAQPRSARSDGASEALAALGLSMADECLLSLRLAQGREPEHASVYDRYLALATAIRRRQMDRWVDTEARCRDARVKQVSYLSQEFLVGRTLKTRC